jgi:hypothetical protein
MAVARPATDEVAVLDNMMVRMLFLVRASGVMGRPLRGPMCRSTASFLAGAVLDGPGGVPGASLL